jgi:hypothetical protein
MGESSSGTRPQFTIESGSTTYKAVSAETTNDNQWYHLTGVRKGKYIILYVNGVEKARTYIGNVSINNVSGRTLKIAKIDSGGSYGLDGLVDDVKIYNYARTPEQIMRDYLEGPPPIGYWKFDDFSGTTAVDSSGNGNDGTIVGAAWEARGKKGSALKFDFSGNNDYVDLGDPANESLDFGTGNFSISLWFKKAFIMVKSPGWPNISSAAGWTFYTRSTNPYIVLNWGDASDNDQYFGFSTQSLDDGKWHHAVVTVERGGTTRGYIDGIQTASASNTVTGSISNSANFYIMRSLDNALVQGYVDEVKIWNYALTPRQVAMEYNNGGPVGYWKFDEGAGEAVYDYSGNGNNGTLVVGSGGTQTSTSSAWSNGSSGKINGSLNFDGTDDYISISDDNSLDLTSRLTIAAWVKTSKGTSESVVTKYGNYYFAINRDSITDGRFSLYLTSWKDSVSSVNDGAWHHIAATWDGSYVRLYKDGELDASFAYSGTLTANSNPVEIGRRSDIGWYFNGQIDEVKIWNYALTPEEIKREYNGGFGSYFK